MIEKYLRLLKIPLVVVGLIFIWLIISQTRSCYNEGRDNEINRLQGLVSQLEKETQAQKEEMGAEIGKRDEKNKALEADRARLSKESEATNTKIKEKDKEISQLEAEFEGLESLQDRYNNILKQNISLKQDLTLEREDKTKIQKSLDNAIKEAENERTSKEKALKVVDKQANLIANLKEINKKVTSQNKRMSLNSKISKTILIPLAVFGTYRLVKPSHECK